MKLWLLSQDENTDSMVVCAKTEAEARNILPPYGKSWSSPNKVSAKYLGETKSYRWTGVILASFHVD